jgi:DNA-binding beta-propeller fold protein YncE
MTSATTNGFIVEISGNSVVSTMQIGVVGWEPVLLAYDPNDGYMYALNDDGAGTVSIVET